MPDQSRPVRRSLVAATVVGVAAALLAGCAGPALGSGAYRQSAAHAVTAMSGTLASAELAARLDQQGRMVFTVTDDAVTNAEDDGSSIAQTFISRQPPTSADTALAAKVSDALDAGTTALTDLRIAVRQHDSAGVRRAIGELTTARVTCQRLTAQLQ